MHRGVLSLPFCKWVWRCANLNAGAMARNLCIFKLTQCVGWRVGKTCQQIWFDIWSKGNISWTVLCNSFGLKTGERAGKTCNGQLRHLSRKFRQFWAEKDAEFSWGHDLFQNHDNYRNHCHQAPWGKCWVKVAVCMTWATLRPGFGEAGHNHSIAIVRTDSQPFVLLAGLYLMQTLAKGLYLIQTLVKGGGKSCSWEFDLILVADYDIINLPTP